MNEGMGKKLNLGCGMQVVDGWINVDYSLGSRLSRIPFFHRVNSVLKLFNVDWDPNIFVHDLTKPLPWKDDTVDVVYTSHTIEHLTKEDGKSLIGEAYRVLRPGGVIRVIVPDLNVVVERLVSGDIPAEDFIDALGAGVSEARGVKGAIKKIFEFPHRCMYTQASMENLLKDLGFEISSANSAASSIADLELIEIPDRLIDAVVVEAQKVR